MFVYFKHVCIFDSELKQNTKTMANRYKKVRAQRPALTNEIVGALADAFKKDPLTIRRWIKKDSVMLTTDIAKKVFSEKNIDWGTASDRREEERATA